MEGSIMGESWRAEYYMYLPTVPYLTYGTRRYRYLLGGTAIGKTEAGAGQEQGRNRAGAIMVMGLSVARGNEAEVAQVGDWVWCGVGSDCPVPLHLKQRHKLSCPH